MNEGVVDLRRYPQLAGFPTPAAVTEMLALAGELSARAWASDQAHTVCFEPPDASAAAPADQLGADLRRAPGMKLSKLTQELFYGRTA